MQFEHIGLITTEKKATERFVPATRVWVTDYLEHPFRVEWLRFEAGSPVPDPVRRMPHVGFLVDNIRSAASGLNVLLKPFDAGPRIVGFYQTDDGAVVEFQQYKGEGGRGKAEGGRTKDEEVQSQENHDITTNRSINMQFDHIGIITTEKKPGEMFIAPTKVWVTQFMDHPYHIEWLRFEPDSPVSGPVRDMPHVAYRVDDIEEASAGLKVLLEPFDVGFATVGFFQTDDGAVVEFMKYKEEGV